MNKLIMALALSFLVFNADAQSKEVTVDIKPNGSKGKQKIKIVKEKDGKMEVIEQEISSDMDFLLREPKGNNVNENTTVTVTESNTENGDTKVIIEKNVNGKKVITERIISREKPELEFNQNRIVDIDTVIDGKRKKIIINEEIIDSDWRGSEYGPGNDRYSRSTRKNGQDLGKDFDIQMERLNDQLADLPIRLRKMRPNFFEDRLGEMPAETGIKSVQVFTNMPDTFILNLKFYAPSQGDVKIVVVDVNGVVVEKTEIKQFKGEYVGQLKLPKDTKGIHFVMISQNDEAISKKIRIVYK